jgi:hypothetical protein
MEAKTRGRLTVSARASAGLPWLVPGSEILAVLEELGRVRLWPWAAAEPVRARLEELAGLDGVEVEDELMLLQDRYQRLFLDSDARLDLPDHVFAHLQASHSVTVFLARYRQHVELWSTEYREARLSRAGRSFPTLP